MDNDQLVSEYLRLSDIMYQALKANKYKIFELAMAERGTMINDLEEDCFQNLNETQKIKYRDEIEKTDRKIERALNEYRKKLEGDLAKIHASKAKLRKQENVKKYYSTAGTGQGRFFDGRK